MQERVNEGFVLPREYVAGDPFEKPNNRKTLTKPMTKIKPNAPPISSLEPSSSSCSIASSSSLSFIPEPSQVIGGSSTSSAAAEEPAASREGWQESIIVDRRNRYSAFCRWTVAQFPKFKARALWSRYFDVGGYDCQNLIYPKGDSQALPDYLRISVY